MASESLHLLHGTQFDDELEGPEHATVCRTTVLRLNGGEAETCDDHVVEEVPVALVFNGISHAVMLATPDNLEDMALGFALTEGILESPSELYGVEVVSGCQGLEVHLEISSRRFVALKERRRNLAGRTGCGLCGIDSLEEAVRAPPPVGAGRAFTPAESLGRAFAKGLGLLALVLALFLTDIVELHGLQEGVAVGSDVIEHEGAGAGEMGVHRLAVLGGEGYAHMSSFQRPWRAGTVRVGINQPQPPRHHGCAPHAGWAARHRGRGRGAPSGCCPG